MNTISQKVLVRKKPQRDVISLEKLHKIQLLLKVSFSYLIKLWYQTTREYPNGNDIKHETLYPVLNNI